ncbi:alkaline phosphatase-like protein [Suhomyces tanzawaensis NRRL Y-17324]|uniref:Alkaline phosphatase-like protein n=1 Tax=Suhomyces tanzawaensis NRRL Y-17324 TaxID=984487 RepID=A0A1E4SBU3_9ASCO|nr:alkaline phosphatase-like protein [Suhomyces tanzawaensis NRRL Y-17324]ODV76936.1 alkaline phosphatase-like protein [Suhomyces tanzawaensis NRRL Y-17324]
MTIDKKPNFIVIVADDLGFTDLSAFGGEIDTPNLKRLGEKGYRFTDFHTASACSPTRSMLLSGTDNHIAGLGQMAEFARDFPDRFGGKPGYEGYLNFKVVALPEILHDAGYYTLLSGKWHLGLTQEYWPSARGFEKTFTLLPGAGNHFKYFPKDEQTGETASFMKPLFEENGKSIDPYSLPEDYYSSDYFTDRFINYLNHDDRDGRPFFGFLTYTAPHWPYQAPEDVIEKYKGVYDDGPQELRSKRLANALKLGIIPEGVVPHQVETQREKAWKDLSDEEKKVESRIMETYAAMVDVLDQNIGRLLDNLEATGELDNTFILFMSDNGAEGMLMEALPLKNDNFKTNLEKNYNNSLENIGKKDSFVWYSDQWAQAATAPSYMYKMWASEGGIRCPLIIHYPDLINNEKKGQVKHGFTTVMDILPTILEIAGIEHPGEEFQGRKVAKVRGSSWLKYLRGDDETVHSEDSVVGWELFAQQAIRKGKYKALFIPKPLGPDRWQLFDLSKDPGETRDLSEEQAEKLNEMLNHWTQYVAETGLVECTDLFNHEYERKILYD